MKKSLILLAEEFEYINADLHIETTFLIFPGAYGNFMSYLDLVDKAEALLEKENYESVYQLASFHPGYCFAGSDENDAANYTNRSPYPMLQILREDSVTKALAFFPAAENIPVTNIDFARKKGLQYMQLLRVCCME